MPWGMRRSRNSFRIQEDAAARQKEMAPRLLESIERQREGLAAGQPQLAALQKILDGLPALRADRENR